MTKTAAARPPHTTAIAEDARAQLGRLRAAWSWLAEARIPGPPTLHADRPQRVRDAAAAAAAYAADRAAAAASIRRRIVPGGPRPVPVRLEPVHARTVISTDVAELTALAWQTTRGELLKLRLRDPDQRQMTTRCPWCHGTTVIDRPDGWMWWWPSGPVTCHRCHHGRIPTGETCPGCRRRGPCSCDRPDIMIGTCMTVLGDLLDVCDIETAAAVETVLYEAATLAERAAGAGTDVRRLPGNPTPECPVCRSRELIAEVSSPDPREWSIRCTGPDCTCQGSHACACGIGQPRRKGRPHLWPAATWDGPTGLARRLGVTLPGRAAQL